MEPWVPNPEATRVRDELGDNDERLSWEDHTDTLASHLHPPRWFPTRQGDHRSFKGRVWLDAAPAAESGSLRDLCKSSPALNFMGEDTQVQGRNDLFQGGVEWDLNLESLVRTAGSAGAARSSHRVFPLQGVGGGMHPGELEDSRQRTPRTSSPESGPCTPSSATGPSSCTPGALPKVMAFPSASK